MLAAWTTLRSQPYWYSEERGRESGLDEEVERRIQRCPKAPGEEAAGKRDSQSLCAGHSLAHPRRALHSPGGPGGCKQDDARMWSSVFLFKIDWLEEGDIGGLQALARGDKDLYEACREPLAPALL